MEGICNSNLSLGYHELCTQDFRGERADTVAHGVNFISTLLIILKNKLKFP
jgi:hypothetical protein